MLKVSRGKFLTEYESANTGFTYMGEISQGVQSLNLMSYLSGVLRPFFGDLGLCYGKNWNSFWKYMSGKVCTYLCLDHSCISGLFKGPYILLSLTY